MQENFPLGILPEFAGRQDENFLATVQKLADWDFGTIEQQMMRRDKIAPDLVRTSKEEFQRYFASMASTNRRLAAPVQADIFWHAFINDTMAYERFCKEVFGRFIHHIPGDYGDVRDRKNLEVVERTVSLFKQMYGIELNVSPQPHPISTNSHSVECECGGEDGY